MAGWKSGVLRYGALQKGKLTKAPKRETINSYKKKAWSEFSRYIRLKHADHSGMSRCVTCGAVKHWKELQAGHFTDGRRNAVLFDERNVHPQCVKCNMFSGGNKVAYYDYMRMTYGQETIDSLLVLDKTERKFTRHELIELREKYKLLANEYEKV